ncbi:MAG: hypothetical protein MUE80_04810, partial [Acidobacteria bacterium]|nr:hypothetical protein [Acidobacteriota bacterium]
MATAVTVLYYLLTAFVAVLLAANFLKRKNCPLPAAPAEAQMIRKAAIAGLGLVLAVLAGLSFHRSRHLPEPVVAGPGVARVASLGDYFAPVKGTVNDAHVYILEGREPGGTVLLLGGTHAEEPAGRLASWIFAENAELARGRLLVVLTANRSGS